VRAAIVLGTNLLVAAAGLAWVLHRHGDQAVALLARSPSLPMLAAFVLAVVIGFAVSGLRWDLLLAGLGCPVGIAALIACRAAGQSVSWLIPSGKLGGDPLRAYLVVQEGVPAPQAIASVAVDRTLEMGGASMFATVFAVVLAQQGIPALRGAVVTVCAAAAGLAAGVTLTVRRLRRGQGLVTAAARGTRLDRFALVRNRMQTIAAAEGAMAALVRQPRRVAVAFTIGMAVHVVVLAEYWLLLAAFGLPSRPVAVVAAIFATGATHSMPVPAGVGVLEGGQMWLFSMLGYPPDVGLAVGLAVRLRELVWTLPGLAYLAGRTLRSSMAARRAA